MRTNLYSSSQSLCLVRCRNGQVECYSSSGKSYDSEPKFLVAVSVGNGGMNFRTSRNHVATSATQVVLQNISVTLWPVQRKRHHQQKNLSEVGQPRSRQNSWRLASLHT